LVNGTKKPDAGQVADWLGTRAHKRWSTLTQFIETNYPGTFEKTWLFWGNKYGWILRFKKSKSFCSLEPERGRFRVLLIFGAEERKKIEVLLPSLTPYVQEVYAKSTTFHDGRWVWIPVENAKVLPDIERLLILKRAPKATKRTSVPGGRRRSAH
jgi:hypothetical protein